MFERFTDRARRVVVLAQEEARALNHNYIGTEHVLLGLVREEDGVACRALDALDVSLHTVRTQVERIIGPGAAPVSGHIPFTPRAKRVLELSLREALQLGHSYIGTEHLLLGMIREGEGVACQVLVKLGADLNRVRQQVIQIMSGYAESPEGFLRTELRIDPTTFPLCRTCRIPLAGSLRFSEEFGTPVPETKAEALAYMELEVLAEQDPTSVTARAGVSESRWLRAGMLSGPACKHCGGSLQAATGGRFLDAAGHDQPGSLRVLLLYCTSCGAPFHAAFAAGEV